MNSANDFDLPPSYINILKPRWSAPDVRGVRCGPMDGEIPDGRHRVRLLRVQQRRWGVRLRVIR